MILQLKTIQALGIWVTVNIFNIENNNWNK